MFIDPDIRPLVKGTGHKWPHNALELIGPLLP